MSPGGLLSTGTGPAEPGAAAEEDEPDEPQAAVVRATVAVRAAVRAAGRARLTMLSRPLVGVMGTMMAAGARAERGSDDGGVGCPAGGRLCATSARATGRQ